jgi:hypothetical protein
MTSRTTRSYRSAIDADQPFQRALAVVDHVRLVALGFEIEAQSLGEVMLVLHDEHAVRGPGGHTPAARGRSSVNVLPWPPPDSPRRRARHGAARRTGR